MKILFFPFAPSLGHVTRCLSLAEELRRIGHDCIFAIGQERINMVKEAGFHSLSIPEVDSSAYLRSGGMKWFSKQYFERNLTADRNVIAETNPDKIVFDYRFTASLAAKISGRRSISILHGTVPYLVLEPRRSAQNIVAPNPRYHGFPARVAGGVFPLVFPHYMAGFLRPLRGLLQDHGVGNMHSMFQLLWGDVNLVADIPEMIPTRIPDNFHIVGPLLWSGWDRKAPIPDERDPRPFIYVTMGSTVEAQITTNKLIDALSDSNFRVIISGGNLDFKRDLPANIKVYPMVPGNTVAERSSLVICHGGHETVMQALWHGKPLLVLPSNPDQIIVGRQIERFGVGKVLKSSDGLPVDRNPLKPYSQAQIRNEIESLLDDDLCRTRCKALQKTIAKYRESKLYLPLIAD